MNDDKLLQQEEVDALLKATQSSEEILEEKTGVPGTGGDTDNDDRLVDAGSNARSGTAGEQADPPESARPVTDQLLLPEEKDALGEIGNISMGSAATTLSQLLNKRVHITSPTVAVTGKKDFLKAYNMPCLVIKVKFKEGFDGYNMLIIKLTDAIVMANLMMGGDGTEIPADISEMEISAAAEAMNQMVGTASTSLADLLSRKVDIMPPESLVVRETDRAEIDFPFSDPFVVISFRMHIKDLLDTRIMQIIDLHTAREQSELLWKKFSDHRYGVGGNSGPGEPAGDAPGIPVENNTNDDQTANQWPGTGKNFNADQTSFSGRSPDNGPKSALQIDQDKLSLLLDIPLKVSVVLGRTKKQIRDVLQMTPGAIVELETMVGEPVEILVNGKLVATGEVVVVNENFGVKITGIISARERIHSLAADKYN